MNNYQLTPMQECARSFMAKALMEARRERRKFFPSHTLWYLQLHHADATRILFLAAVHNERIMATVPPFRGG